MKVTSKRRGIEDRHPVLGHGKEKIDVGQEVPQPDGVEGVQVSRRHKVPPAVVGPIPGALDETLLAFLPEIPPPLHGVAALILKPSVLGGYERAAAWARLARREGSEAVVSAAFPSAVGLALDAAFAAALLPDGVHGLGTSDTLAEDLARTLLAVTGGAIDAGRLPLRPADFALEHTRVLR